MTPGKSYLITTFNGVSKEYIFIKSYVTVANLTVYVLTDGIRDYNIYFNKIVSVTDVTDFSIGQLG